MKKNSQIHIFLETELKEKLEKQAQEENLTLSEFCRKKLKNNSQLDKIETILEKILKKLDFIEESRLYKSKNLEGIDIINKVPLNHSKV